VTHCPVCGECFEILNPLKEVGMTRRCRKCRCSLKLKVDYDLRMDEDPFYWFKVIKLSKGGR
jgi:hypothetical protein